MAGGGCHTDSYRRYSPDCHLNSWLGFFKGRGGGRGRSHWVVQRVLIRLSPEYCRLFASKMAYKGRITGTPGSPGLRPCHSIAFLICCKCIAIWLVSSYTVFHNYSPKWRWLAVDIYRDNKHHKQLIWIISLLVTDSNRTPFSLELLGDK